MYIQQIYTGCLSEAAYYIESNGEAAVIDPLRDTDAYTTLAAERKAVIKYIFETHFHADFVSGHIDLSKATGATIVYGPGTKANFEVHVAKDGERFALGNIHITALHTPGHTLESTCFLVTDENGKDHSIFTGDTLFVGDVGRPDLAQKGADLTMNDLAGMLYDSLQQKIVPLHDDVIVYPGHGAGSACGKNMGTEAFSTIGQQKETNYALKAKHKTDFIKAVTEGLNEPPAYFAVNAEINKQGYESLDAVLQKGLEPLSVQAIKDRLERDAILLDTRQPQVFTTGFVPGSINIGLDGRFAEWAGQLIPFRTPIVLVANAGEEKESLVRLARVGFSDFAGYLDGGFEAWEKAGEEIDMIIDVEADELAMDIPFDEKLLVLDVRKPAEYANGHVKDALNIPLNELTDNMNIASIEDDQNVYIHCGSGYRSVIAASLLKRQGMHNLRNVLGGWDKIKEQDKIEKDKEKSVLN
jgi:hydroxyacylglutathione hydrolase